MSYYTRGLGCCSHTSALTSNHKFLPLKANIYWHPISHMMYYPGTGGYYYPEKPYISNKEQIRNFLKSNSRRDFNKSENHKNGSYTSHP